ncbi:MAG: ferredoxin family protein [Candidatus Sifarchaeia archaeon]
MPIDRTFRKTWKIVKQHLGHPVWQSPQRETAYIHGHLVGVDFSLCYGCEKCIDACPTNVFVLIQDESEHLVVDPAREEDCILCLVCEIVCPVQAISLESASGSDATLNALLEGNRG